MTSYTIRQASGNDIEAVAAIYEEQLSFEEAYGVQTHWKRGVYPTKEVAVKAVREGTLYTAEAGGTVCGAMILNSVQAPEYAAAEWKFAALPQQVLVIHTLCIAPSSAHEGLGQAMVTFAEKYAAERGCTAVRLDTWAGNKRARRLYTSLGYRLAGSLPAMLNGLIPLELVFFEKAVTAVGTAHC